MTVRSPGGQNGVEGADMELSLIIPAYNESDRLPGFLARVLQYFDIEYSRGYEILVVDDGSTDATASVVEGLCEQLSHVRLIQHANNRGKGAAVQTGMLAACGRLRLFADADGSTPIKEERQLRKAIGVGADIAIGSRAAREIRGPLYSAGRICSENEVKWDIRLHRFMAGRTFALLTKVILGLSYADTQCGFKMFRGEVAIDLFNRMRQQEFIFDCEVLYLADKLGYRVFEVPVNWHDVPGSKVHLIRDSWRMFRGLWQISYRHAKLGTHEPVPVMEPLLKS